MGELLVRFVKSVIQIVWLRRIPCSPKLFSSRKEIPSPSRRLIVMLQGDVLLPTLKDIQYRVEETPSTNTRTPARWMDVPHSTVWSFYMSRNCTLTIPRRYMQWVQLILHSVLISVCGSYPVVCKSPSFHDRYSPQMNASSFETLQLFQTHETVMFRMTKTPCPARPWIPATFRH